MLGALGPRHHGRVGEALRVLTASLAVGSLLAICGYLVALVQVSIWTVATARRRSPLLDELDQFLHETVSLRP